jgi:hypothetical protein
LAAAGAGWWWLRRDRPERTVATLAVASVLFTSLCAALPIASLDEYKAPRQLVSEAGIDDSHRDLRLVAFQWFQPSVVFYSRREVEKAPTWDYAADLLAMQAPVYLFIPAPIWDEIRRHRPETPNYRAVGRHFDLYANCDILVLTNQ